MRINPVLRATGVIGSVAALVTGVTFAALSSTATLTNNSISSATADLQVKSTSETFSSTDLGFDFTGIVPGGSAKPTVPFAFQLKNNGGVNGASLNVSVSLASLPSWVVTPLTSTDPNPSKVHVYITCTGGITATLDTTLSALTAVGGVALGGPLSPAAGSEVASCGAQAYMEESAFSGSSAASSDFDLVFTGTGVVL